jgi:hypothetical protein
MENQTAVTGFRVPGRGRSNCSPYATGTAEFVRGYFADAGTDFRADLRTNLLEQARPILAREKLAAEQEQVKARMFCIARARRETHKELWLLIQDGERFQSKVASPRRVAVMCVEVYRGPS